MIFFATNKAEFVKNSDASPFSADLSVLFGISESHVIERDGLQLQAEVLDAFHALATEARAEGFELSAASSYRSFARQALIFNGKMRGERVVLDDNDQTLDQSHYSDSAWLHAILRFSALPGTSRHHWGTDLDVYDRAALSGALQLTVQESRTVFADLHAWLDERMALDQSFGFFRPYGRDRGGISPEPWHLSYAPLAAYYEDRVTPANWRELITGMGSVIEGLTLIDHQLEEIFDRFVSVPREWCPDHYRSGQAPEV